MHATHQVESYVGRARKSRGKNQETRGAEEAKSREGMERSRGRPRKKKNEMRGNEARTRVMMWWLIEEGAFVTTGLSTDIIKAGGP